MRCIKCLFKNLTIRRLFLVFVFPLSLFGSLFLSSSVSAVSGTYPLINGTGGAGVVTSEFNSAMTAVTIVNRDSTDQLIDGTVIVPLPKTASMVCLPIVNLTSSTQFNNQQYSLSISILNASLTLFNSSSRTIGPDKVAPSNTVIEFNAVNDYSRNFEYHTDSGSSVIDSSRQSSLVTYNVKGVLDGSGNYICFGYNSTTYTAYKPWDSSYFTTGGVKGLLRGSISFYSDSATNAIEEQTAQDKQYHDENQQQFNDAQDTANTDADTSSEQAESSGSTLLQAVTSFIGALTGSSASNCVINANIGDFQMGNVDLCQLSPPPAFQIISSLMVIGFTVPLSIALAKKMIGLFRSFQG